MPNMDAIREKANRISNILEKDLETIAQEIKQIEKFQGNLELQEEFMDLIKQQKEAENAGETEQADKLKNQIEAMFA